MKAFKLRRGGMPALEWMCDLSGRTARVTSIGNRSLLVENHCGIREFSQDRIVLASHSGCIQISGRALELNQVRPGALIVRGNIQDVKLPCEEESP